MYCISFTPPSDRPWKEVALSFCMKTQEKRTYLRGKSLHMKCHDSERSVSRSSHFSPYIPLPSTISNVGVGHALYECMFIHNPNKICHILLLGRFYGMIFEPLGRVIYFDTVFGKSAPISPFVVAGTSQLRNHPSVDTCIRRSLESWRPHGLQETKHTNYIPIFAVNFAIC